MTTTDPRLAIGGNSPPLALTIRENHNDVFTRLDELAAADALVPAVITSDEDEGKAQDLVLQCKKTVKHAEAMHKLEKEPYDKAVKEIEGALSRGATVAECCEVLDYCWREWRDNPKMVGHVDKTTPFRKANFDRYLDAARAGRITTSTAPDNEPIPREVLANLEFELADGTDIEAWLAAQRPGWVPALRERASRMAGGRR